MAARQPQEKVSCESKKKNIIDAVWSLVFSRVGENTAIHDRNGGKGLLKSVVK